MPAFFRARTRRFCMLVAVVGAVFLIALGATPAHAAPAVEVAHGPRTVKQVALTFDDNSLSERALPILRVLREYEVPATMFVIGYLTENYPDITQAIADGVRAGLFEVGDHTRSHPWLTTLSPAGMAAQIGGGTDAFHELTGLRTVPLFRPPGGFRNDSVRQVAGDEGFKYLVMWDVDPRDWAGNSAASIRSTVLDNARSGSIVVLHLCAQHTAEALPEIITGLRGRGFELVTVSHMLRDTRRFLDVDEDMVEAPDIERVARLGYMTGYDGNYFGPHDFVTEQQVSAVLLRAGYPIVYGAGRLEQGHIAGLRVSGEGPGAVVSSRQLSRALGTMARLLRGYPEEVSAGLDGGGMVPMMGLASPELGTLDLALLDPDARRAVNLGLVDAQLIIDDAPLTRAALAQALCRYLELRPYWCVLYSEWLTSRPWAAVGALG